MATAIEKRLAKLDKETAAELGLRLFLAALSQPEIFLAEDKDAEQEAWFEAELQKLGK
jgi:hypothetical protein